MSLERQSKMPIRFALITGCLAATTLLGLMTTPVCSAPTVELTIGGTPYRGLNVVHNQEVCWLAARDGSYERIQLSEVTAFRKVGGEFRSLTPGAMAADLRETLGRKFEILTRGQFVICAPPGKSEQYAELLLGVQHSFDSYFSRRGWSLGKSSFPLLVYVHPNKHEFDKNCLMLGMQPSAFLRGFYHPQTNRVMLYDLDSDVPPPGAGRAAEARTGELSAAARHVAIHETIHQLAFNSGLHQRVGQNPRWVVEGLATMLEAGALDSKSRTDVSSRVNPERLQQFRENRAKRRHGTIIDLVTKENELYESAPLDFYSEAWALTFYLSESQRAKYVRYLKRLSDRDPLETSYSAEERLADMQAVFGQDLRWLETKFLRYMDDLE